MSDTGVEVGKIPLSEIRGVHLHEGIVDTGEVVDRALTAIDSDDIQLAQEALRVLGLAQVELAVIVRSCRALNPHVRSAAVNALAAFDHTIATDMDALAEALADENSYVACAALSVVTHR